MLQYIISNQELADQALATLTLIIASILHSGLPWPSF